MNDRNILIILALVLVVCYLFTNTTRAEFYTETMAPLNWGAYKNNYPRGKCNPGNDDKTSCSVGNCPLGSTVSNNEYCGIQCAQNSDPVEREKCHAECMNMMLTC
jgi:hypothetical protein